MKTALLILALTLTLGCAATGLRDPYPNLSNSAEKSAKNEPQTDEEQKRATTDMIKMISDTFMQWNAWQLLSK